MKQGARLQLKLGQKTRLAPQLRQAIALLQLNRGDLHQTIREALDTNPLLERDDGDQSDSVSDDFAEHDADTDTSAGEIDDAFGEEDRKSTRLNSSHVAISYAVFCLT